MSACAPSGSSRERLALGLFAAALLAATPLLAHPWYVPLPDASLYITTARSLLAGEGYTHLGEPFVMRPPGFSLLIAPVLAVSGPDFALLNLWVGLFGALAAVLLALHQRQQLGLPLAMGVAGVVWINPGFRSLCNTVLSDVPGLALLLLCLLVEPWARRGPAWPRDAVLGVLLGVCAYLRFANLLLLPAILASRLLAGLRAQPGPPKATPLLARLGIPLVFAGLVVLPWALRDAALTPTTAVDQTRLHSYSTALWHLDPGDPASPRLLPAAVLGRVPLRARQIAASLGSGLQSGLQAPIEPAEEGCAGRLGLALLLLGSSAVALVRRRAPAELFVWITLAFLSLYFGFADRLLLPIYALCLPALVELLRDGAGAVAGRRAATALAAVALAGLAALELRRGEDLEEIERRHRGYETIAAALASRLAPGERLASAVGYHYAVYLDRPVYSVELAMRRSDDPERALETTIDRHGIDAVVLWSAMAREHALIGYFEERYGPGERVGPARLWRVRPAGGSGPSS